MKMSSAISHLTSHIWHLLFAVNTLPGWLHPSHWKNLWCGFSEGPPSFGKGPNVFALPWRRRRRCPSECYFPAFPGRGWPNVTCGLFERGGGVWKPPLGAGPTANVSMERPGNPKSVFLCECVWRRSTEIRGAGDLNRNTVPGQNFPKQFGTNMKALNVS